MPAAKCQASGAHSQLQTRRFNGIDQTSRQWNSLHKDRDLWDNDANCVVHLHAKGSSQRPPSLRIPFAAVQQSKSTFLLENCLSIRKVSNTSISSDSGYEESSTLSSPQPDMYDLYIPAPANLTREQAYTYHVTTRNFFAFLTKQALVGEKLGLAMTNLCQRMKEWLLEGDATVKLLSYFDEQGYLSLANNITHATAILTFAEGAEIRDLWTNAFVHCVGMYDRLDLSRDYPELRSTTKALITRASLELDLHMSRATRAIGCFLEEELGADRLGLSKPARNHLDRFRGFLHSHYLEQVGYFPPDSSDPYNKKLWNDIHDDFESLYELLADTTSDMSIQNNSNASGGICCLQNTQAFDSRHGCTPLPHPCPLLPSMELPKRATETQRTLRSLRLGRSSSTLSESKLLPRRALAEATNSIPDETSNRPIIAAYRHFERMRLEEKVTLQEARKIRWLLIYGALQILNSITRAPKGVRDIEAASYPLCVLTNGLPEWHNVNTGEVSPAPGQSNAEDLLDLELTTPLPLTPDEEARPDSEGRISIHPDCEADNAADYFSNSRRSSINALDMTPPPLRITRPTRTTSIRMSVSSGVDVLQRSLSMARRNSSRKMAQAPKPGRTNSYEVVGQGYGDVTQKRVMLRDPAGDTIVVPVTGSIGTKHNLWQEFDFGLPDVGEEPILNDRHLDSIIGLDTMCAPHQLVTNFEPAANTASPQEADDSTSGKRNSWVVDESAFSASWRAFDSEPASATTSGSEPNSLRSSYLADRCDTPATMYSPSQSPRSSYPSSVDFDKSHASQQSQKATGQRHIGLIATRDTKPCLNAGCYRPSGLPSQSSLTPALSKFASSQTIGTAASTPNVGSAASSIYHMDRQQADERGSTTDGGSRWKKISHGLAEFSFDR